MKTEALRQEKIYRMQAGAIRYRRKIRALQIRRETGADPTLACLVWKILQFLQIPRRILILILSRLRQLIPST
jgi:hypothetical protein